MCQNWSGPQLGNQTKGWIPTLSKSTHTIMVIGIVLWLGGCVSVGKDFSLNTDWIQVNQTTQVQVADQLGVPEEVGMNGDTTIWTYYHMQISVWNKLKRKEIRIAWNPNLTVQSYNLMQSPVTTKESLLLPSSGRHHNSRTSSSESVKHSTPIKVKPIAQDMSDRKSDKP